MNKRNSNSTQEKKSKRPKESLQEETEITTPSSISPDKAYFDRLSLIQQQNNSDGVYIIQGKDQSDEENEEEVEDDESDSGDPLTEIQLSRLRYILANKTRERELKKAEKYATDGQQDQYVMMFNTHSGNVIISKMKNKISEAMKKSKLLNLQFDSLFGLTYALYCNDTWMNDNEEAREDGLLAPAIAALGDAWRNLLSHSDEPLGIDPEFTRPGIECLLEKFEQKCKELGNETEFIFDWRPTFNSPAEKAFYDRKDQLIRQYKCDCSYIIEADDRDTVEGRKEEDNTPLTEEQLASLRYVFINSNRMKEMNKADSYANPESSPLELPDSLRSWKIIQLMRREISAATKNSKPLHKQLDSLLALTYQLQKHCDFWFKHFDESKDVGISSLEALGHAWKTLLAHSNEDLGIDPEFTRPGIESLLEKFERKCHRYDDSIHLNWR